MLIGGGEAGVVPGLGQGLLEHRLLQRAGPGEAQPMVHHHPDPDAGRGGRGQGLDLAGKGPYLGLIAAGHIDLDLLAGTGPSGHPLGHRHQLVGVARGGPLARLVDHGAHSAVPPMVTPVSRRVAWPHPTGTLWPSLPQVPGVMPKSPATASIRLRISGPLPIRLASRRGSVIRPPSMR